MSTAEDVSSPRAVSADDGLPAGEMYAEARAGTDPTDPASLFRLRIHPAPTGQGVTLEWDTITNRTHALWWTATLDQPPQLLQAGIEATPTVNTYLDPTSANRPAGFYQVVVEP